MSSRIRRRSKKRKSRSRDSSRSKRRRKSPRSSLSRKLCDKLFRKKLFRMTQQHHKKCLRQLFLKYYEPSLIDGTFEINHQWTSNVDKNVLNTLRLHLTWVLEGEVFHWTDDRIGKRILKIFSVLGSTSSTKFISHVQ